MAPGAWAVGPYQTNQSNRVSFFYLSGTSMASPHVAGIVALMSEKAKRSGGSLTASQAEGFLEAAAAKSGLAKEGCATVIREAEEQCWKADAVGSGFVTADAALAEMP